MSGIRNILFFFLLAFLLVSDVVDCKRARSRRKGSRRTPRAKVESTRISSSRRVSEDCIIEYDSAAEGHILPLVVGPSEGGFLYPSMEENRRILRIPSGEDAIAACSGPNNRLLLNGKASATISCQKGSLYSEQNAVTWSQFGCRSKPRPSLERESTSCGNEESSSSSSLSLRGTSYSVKWLIGEGVVVPQFSICFCEEAETALYTHHTIEGRHISAKVVDPDRPGFKKERMFSVDANRLYGKDDQGALFLQLLEDGSHLTEKKQHYLARGHLSPDSDFVLEAEQDATYFYANAVPSGRPSTMETGSLENSVRELAQIRGRAIEVWTGIHDVLHLPNGNSKPVELFLGLSEKRRVIPVPALLWKVIYDRSAKEAIAIVAVNDVRGFGSGSDPSTDLHDPPCRDVCAKATWVDWDTSDLTSAPSPSAVVS